MSGSDFLWWLEEIWLDLTNLDTADLPSLVFRIIVLVGVVFFGTFLLRVTVTVIGGLTRSYIVPPAAAGVCAGGAATAGAGGGEGTGGGGGRAAIERIFRVD